MSAVAAASATKHAMRRAAAFASNPPMSSPPVRLTVKRSTRQQSVSARSLTANTFFAAGRAAPLGEWPQNAPSQRRQSHPARRANNRRAQARNRAPLRRRRFRKSGALEKRQRADFDALARPRVGRRGRVFERGVGGPAGAAVL